MYESVTWDYIKFLVEKNVTDEWGKKLFNAWNRSGQPQPEVPATAAVNVL